MTELTRSDPVILPDGRRGVILVSRGEDRTMVGLEDGTSEQIPRSELRPAMKAELDAQAQGRLVAAHAEQLASQQRRLPETVTLPGGEQATVIGRSGRHGVVVERADGSTTQVHENAVVEFVENV